MHNVLHRFRAGRGVGSAIVELKLAQELASIYQDPLFLVLMVPGKVYDTVDQDRLLVTLEGYGEGPPMFGLLETLWDFQQLVPSQNGFHVPAFHATRGTTQVRLVSPTLFNVLVENCIITWRSMTVKDQRVDHDGLVETVGRCLGVLCSNYGLVGSRY